MTRMGKFPYGLVAAMAIAVGVAGCASGSSQPATPPPAPVAAPAAPPPAPPPPMTPAERGKALQTALNANGAQLTVDGRIGPKTVAALRTYQKAHDLKVTGKPDPATLKALGLGG